MKQILLCLALVLALSGVALASIGFGVWPVLCGAVGGMTVTTLWHFSVLARDWRVRRLAVTALQAEGNVLALRHLVEVLGTPDVVAAHRELLRREATLRATRYANGEADDF